MFGRKAKSVKRDAVGKTADTPALWMKRTATKPAVVRNRFSLKQRINNLFYRNISSRHPVNSPGQATSQPRTRNKFLIPTVSAVVFGAILLLAGTFIYFNYKNAHFEINNLSYINKSSLSYEVKGYLESRRFFAIDTDELSTDLKSKNPLINEVFINKSFVKGMILDVKEYQPEAIILAGAPQDGGEAQKLIYTKEGKLVEYTDVSKEIVMLTYSGKTEQLADALDFIRKSILTVDKLSENGIKGSYTFDNFGNFSILTIGNKIVRLDLKEKYFSLDDQIKVLQNALVINANSSEYDLRFNYLVVKQLK